MQVAFSGALHWGASSQVRPNYTYLKREPLKREALFLVRVTGVAVCGGLALHTIRSVVNSLALLAKNSPPDCFLYARSLLRFDPTIHI